MNKEVVKAALIGAASVMVMAGILLTYQMPLPHIDPTFISGLLKTANIKDAGTKEATTVSKTEPPGALPSKPPFPQGQNSPGSISAIIPVTGGPVRLECRPNTLELPGGSRVVVRGLCGNYWAAVQQESKESLMPSTNLYTLINGITLRVLRGNDPTTLEPLAELPPGALVSYYFLVRPEMAQYHLVGLRLDGDSWRDTGSVRSGLFMEIPANKPGTYAMVVP